MSPLGPVAFAALVWGSVALVLVVFGYELYAIAREYGLFGPE
ncbi:MAG: hypothetical protein ABEJ31_13840 [Haloarculaceae archaeon]